MFIYILHKLEIKAKAPGKPNRVPTIMLKQRPDYFQTKNLCEQEKNDVEKEESNSYDDQSVEKHITSLLNKNSKAYFDVNTPNFNLTSLVELKNYKCYLIKDPCRHLDRFALIEIKQVFLANYLKLKCPSNEKCDCNDLLSQSLTIYLAKCFTYNDLQLLRFNFDFGLGVYNGIEMINLPHGDQVRKDIIERLTNIHLYYFI